MLILGQIVIPTRFLIAVLGCAWCAGAWAVVNVNVASNHPDSSQSPIQKDDQTICFILPDQTTSWNIDVKINRDFVKLPFAMPSASTGTDTKLLDESSDSSCSREFDLGDLRLDDGDSVAFQVQFTLNSDGPLHKKTYIFFKPKKGEVRFGVGAFFIYADTEDFFTQTVDDSHFIRARGGDDFDLNMTVTANWVGYEKSRGPMAGIGADAENVSVFAGYGWTIKRAWTVNLGIAAYKEKRLLSNYEIGQEVPESIDSTALTKDEYQFAPFIGLSWTPEKKN